MIKIYTSNISVNRFIADGRKAGKKSFITAVQRVRSYDAAILKIQS